MAKEKKNRLYLIPTVSRTFDVMELLQEKKAPMSLEAIYNELRFCKTSVYRILQTMAHRGYATRGEDGLYRYVSAPKKMRFGFGGQSVDMPFAEDVKSSLVAAAAASGVELLVLDNQYNADIARKNAEEFIKSNVDLVIEFQIDEQVAPLIANKIAEAGIPLIAIDIPHPHATYFGVDNFRVGLEAGMLLAEYARDQWDSKVDWVLGLDIEEAGALVQSRITGAFEGIRKTLRNIPSNVYIRVDSRGLREKSRRIVTDFLGRHPKDHRILIAASTDSAALGALEVAREMGRAKDLAIVGQDCIPEAMEEMQNPDSPIIASISHQAETYGPRLIELGISLLQGRSVPPYNYVNHRVVTRVTLGVSKAAAGPSNGTTEKNIRGESISPNSKPRKSRNVALVS